MEMNTYNNVISDFYAGSIVSTMNYSMEDVDETDNNKPNNQDKPEQPEDNMPNDISDYEIAIDDDIVFL